MRNKGVPVAAFTSETTKEEKKGVSYDYDLSILASHSTHIRSSKTCRPVVQKLGCCMVSLGEPHYLISRSNFLSPVTPEKLLTQEFQSLLDGLFDEEQLNLLVVDEVGFLNNV